MHHTHAYVATVLHADGDPVQIAEGHDYVALVNHMKALAPALGAVQVHAMRGKQTRLATITPDGTITEVSWLRWWHTTRR